MGTHPIFESDFDCLTEFNGCSVPYPLLNMNRLFIQKVNFSVRCLRHSKAIAPWTSQTTAVDPAGIVVAGAKGSIVGLVCLTVALFSTFSSFNNEDKTGMI